MFLACLNNVQTAHSATGINNQINFQGKIVNKTSGTNITNGTYNVQFKIYCGGDGVPGSTSGDCTNGTTEHLLWTETRLRNNSQGVVFTDGIFQVNLGSVNNTLASSVDFNEDKLWLSMEMGSTNATCTPFSSCTPDGELDPMVRFTAVPQAFNSDLLDGLSSAAFGQLAASQTWTGTNTLQPTTNISSLVVSQTSVGSPTADIMKVTTANGTNNVIQVTGPAANESAIVMTSFGMGRDITLNSADQIILSATASGGDLDLDANDAITLDSASFSIDATTASNLTVTGSGQNLTVSAAGGGAQTLALSSAGTGANALTLSTTAGGIDITSTGAAAGEDIDISTDASINLTSTENAAQSIYLRANGGTSETIQLHADQGTAVNSINLLSDVGGLTLTATGLASADAINLEATAGGIDIDAALSLIADAVQSLSIDVTSATAASNISVAANADAEDLTIAVTGSAGDLILSSADQLTMDAVLLSLDATTSSNLTVTGSAQNLLVSAAGGGTQELQLQSAGTGSAAINIDATAGGIDIDAVTALTMNVSSATSASNISVAADADAEDLTVEVTGSAGDLLLNSPDQIAINGGSSTSVILSDYITDANAVLYTSTTGAITRVAETETGSQCLLSGAGSSGVPTWGSCSAGGGDNISVNSSAAADANFLNTTATASVAGTTWTLVGASTPDDITLAISDASGTVSGVITANAQTLAGLKTFNSGITLAASQTLTVTGGNTASRPANGAGKVYYDTTTNQLIQNNGSKWMGDRAPVTKIVAASNSSQVDKDAADYLATGTGDQSTIQSAIDAVTTGGGVVYLMPGTYTLSAAINIKSNVILAGAGVKSIITFQNSVSAPAYAIAENTNPSNFAIRDLSIDANQDGNATNGVGGIQLLTAGARSGATSTYGARIENVEIHDFSLTGIYMDDVVFTTIENNHIYDGDQIAANNGTGIYSVDSGGGAVERDITIRNNLIHDMDYICISIDSSSSQTQIMGNNVYDCVLDGSNVGGIQVFSAAVVISDNIVTGTQYAGILLSGSSHSTVTGNLIKDTSENGMYVDNSSYTTITGNTIVGTAEHGVILEGATATEKVTVSSNSFQDFGGTSTFHGIHMLGDMNDTLIVNNSFAGSASTGVAINISVSTVDRTYLSNNVFSGTGATSITDSGTGTVYSNQPTATQGAGQTLQGGSIANSGQLLDVNLTFASDSGASDVVSAINVDVTSANDQTTDQVIAFNIGNLSGAGANTVESALRIGTGWDNDIKFEDTTPTIKLGATDNTGILQITDAASTPNVLFEIKDLSTNFGAFASAGAFADLNSYWSEEFGSFRATNISATAQDCTQGRGTATVGQTSITSTTGCVPTSGQISADTTGASTGTTSFGSVADTAGGIERMSAADGNQADMSALEFLGSATANDAQLPFNSNNLPVVLMKVKAPATSSSNVRHSIGIGHIGTATSGTGSVAVAAIGSAASGPTGIWVDNCTTPGTGTTCNDTTWNAHVQVAGTASTNVDCGVTIDSSNFALIKIEVISAGASAINAKVFIDGNVANGVSFTQCTAFSSPPTINNVAWGWFANIDANGSLNGSFNYDIDFVRIWQDDAAPGTETVTEQAADVTEADQVLETSPLEADSPDREDMIGMIDFMAATSEDTVFNKDIYVRGTVFANKVQANEIEGLESLTVTGDAEFQGNTMFKGLVTFVEKTVFNNDIEFTGRATFNNDTAGFAVIKKDEKEVQVHFQKAYEQLPVVTVNAKNNLDVDYTYKDLNKDGFTIVLKDTAASDVEFSWTALSIRDAKTTQTQPSGSSP